MRTLIIKDSIKRIFALGLTLIIPKIPILLAAYILTKENYFFFNKYYYTATMIILWSSFGFGYAISYTKTKYSLIISSILVNVCITGMALLLSVVGELKLYVIAAIMLYSFFITAANVMTFRILYTGRTDIYLIANVINACMLLLAIGLGMVFAENGLILGLIFGSALYFLIVMIFQIKNEKEEFTGSNLKDLYIVGFSSFAINSIVPLLLAADKFIVNHNFENITANSYTFAWGLTAPLFYIGNIFEKMIYSENKLESMKSFKLNFLLNLIFISVYSVLIYGLINITDSLLPQSVSKEIVRSITLIMLVGYSIYAIFHFPVNGYLFKYKNKSVPKNIAMQYIIAAAVFVLIYLLLKDELIEHYSRLLLFNFTILAVLLIIKLIAVFRPFEKKRVVNEIG